MKKFILAAIIFALIPLIGGYFFASATHTTKKPQKVVPSMFHTKAVLPADRVTFVAGGTIVSLTHTGETTIQTNHLTLIEASPLGENYIGIDKQTNYASLDEFSPKGILLRTLQNGNTGKVIDNMDWYTDPAISPDQKEIAFVSDRDKQRTNVPDNALFVENLATNTVKKLAKPLPHSGGIADPVWDPANPHIITYDYYEYDQHFNPYSVIDEYNTKTQQTTQLTTSKQNAYQGAFSPNGKQFIFLERNNNITPIMYIADVTANGLTHIQRIATGDFAYPKFSLTKNHIYYLEAQENNGYDLYTATITNGNLTNTTAISTGEQLLANSGFVVSNK